MARRALFAGLALAGVELALVLACGRDLFLSWLELARYALLALSLLPVVCVPLLFGARLVLAAAARGAGSRSAVFVRRLRIAVTLSAAPFAWLVLWSLSAGRRVRAEPLRVPLVTLLGAACACALAWLLGALARRHLRDERSPLLACALFVPAALALAVDAIVLRRLYPAFHLTLALIAVCSASLAAAFVPERARPSNFFNERASGFTIYAACALALLSSFQLSRAPNARFAIVETAPLTGKLLKLVRPPSAALVPNASPAEPAKPATAQKPGIDLRGRDVLLVTIDALRADRLRAYGGHGLTPGLDALAAQSLVFEHAYTPTPHTSYALTSLMTGKFMQPLLALAASGDEQPTLPQLLRRYGYRTAAFYPPAIFFVDGERFERFRREQLGFEYVKAMFAPASQRVPQLEAYLREVSPGHPLFVWVHLFEPHEPYEPPPEYARGDSPVDRYDGEVAAADAAAAQLVAVFRRARPESTVIVSADHGEEFGEHGGHHHGTTLFDEQVRVPLLWSSPGQTAAGRVRVPVEIIDVTTTLLGALGLARDVRMRGDDLGPWLRDPSTPATLHAFATIAGARMVSDGRNKLICDDDACRLFDLERDPGERRDVAAEQPQTAARLRAELTAFVASVPRVEALAMDGGGGWPRALVRARLGDVAVAPELAPLLDSARADVRAAAARALGELGVDSALGALTRMRTDDTDRSVRAEAAIAALRLGAQDARAEVIALLASDAADAQAARGGPRELAGRAALALALRGDVSGEDVLIADALDGKSDEPQRVVAIRALGVAGRARAGEALLPLLADVRLRGDVAAALGRIGDPRFVSALTSALREERYPEARRSEASALLALGARTEAVSLIRRFLGTESSLPDGVALLLEAGALSRAGPGGADLRSASAVRRGAFACEARGCAPSEGAAIVLPTLASGSNGARVTLRLLADGPARSLRIAGQTHLLSAGANELSWALERSRRLHMDVAADGGVYLVAIAVVPKQPDVPPPPPEPWSPDEPTLPK